MYCLICKILKKKICVTIILICTEQHETNQQVSWVMGLKAHWAEGHPLCHQFPAGSCPAPPVPTPPIQPKAHPRKGKNHIVRSTSEKNCI